MDIRSIREVFFGDLRHLTGENNVVPLRSLFCSPSFVKDSVVPRLKVQAEPMEFLFSIFAIQSKK
jgi:hypothetical protein